MTLSAVPGRGAIRGAHLATAAKTTAGGAKRRSATMATKNPDASSEPAGAWQRSVFPVVGIGASAGGLEALEHFLAKVPANSGMAFVVIQHLDPTQKAVVSELLQRVTAMPVCEASDGLNVKPAHVYVIPPNKDLSLLHGVLHLIERPAAHGLRLPIDFFFRALAADQGARSAAIILSGMGSDGTLGLRAIKDAGGIVLVQDPASAKFDGMPRSAIDAGLADVVAAAEDLPARLIVALQRNGGVTNVAVDKHAQNALDKVLILLRARTGQDFSYYKKNTLYRRIERRMALHQIERIDTYARYLRENSQELDLLFKELLIGVTNFFRDPPAWTVLISRILPELLTAHPEGRALRAWVAGCSTGEEAYSLAIAFREAMERTQPQARFTLQIFATDLDADAIEKARLGFYPKNIAADVSPQGLAHYFVEADGGYRVSREIRELVTFAPQNVIMDPPFTKLDILCCRNLLIYLDPELQKKLLPLFHYSLNPGGVLFLGSAETTASFVDLFTAIDGKQRLYRRIGATLPPFQVDFPTKVFPVLPASPEEARDAERPGNLQRLAEQTLLNRFTAPAVLVNGKGDILFVSGRTGRYLEPAAGKANWNIHAMARDGLRQELNTLLGRALREHATLTASGVSVGVNGGAQTLDLTVAALDEPEALRGTALVVFREVAAIKPGRSRATPGPRLQEAEQDARRLREELQHTREEMQSSQEELKSANEELQSTNEELQSTNEELSTSKEEMQSLNEELHTVNAELQSKLDDLSRANDDMQNLLNSTDIATVFLDDKLRLRRYTTQATKLYKLLPGDIGRPLSDITSDLDYPALAEDAREVLRSLAFSDKQIATGDGRWYQVRVMPYRTQENLISGVVITFTDISIAKKLEAELRRGRGGRAARGKARGRKLGS